jgi:hypothetical protein
MHVAFWVGKPERNKSAIFWNITPCSPLSVNRRFGGTYRLHLQGLKNKLSNHSACHLLSRWFLAEVIFSTLKMEAICSSETSVDTQLTTRRYFPEDGTLHNHRCENLKSYWKEQHLRDLSMNGRTALNGSEREQNVCVCEMEWSGSG